MTRKLASIVEIATCEPIPDTERLSVATMVGKGWKVVVGRDEFKPGDLCIYFEIDSFLNAEDERYAFLRDRCLRRFVSKGGNLLREGLRIKSIKLRGVVSQGLLMPLAKFPEITDNIVWNEKKQSDEWINGSWPDVTELLHVEHYDEVKEQLQPAMGNPLAADIMGDFPSSWIPKTDEERIQNLNEWFKTKKGRRWQVTCKHDGSSCTIAFSPTIDWDEPEVVCSRNRRLKREGDEGKVSVYWQVAEKYGILTKLAELLVGGCEYAIQGEVVGPGINGDRNKETEYKFYCFRIWDIANQKWINPQETVKICKEFDIPHAQIVKDDFVFFDEITTIEDALKFAEGKTEEGNEREGVVCKTIDDGQYASFKIVSNKYLLKQGD